MTEPSMIEMLRRSGGIDAVSRDLGISPVVAAAGTEALLPAVLGGFRKHAEGAGGGTAGLGAMIAMLAGLGGGSLAVSVLGPDATEVDKGNDVLGQIFGSKDTSRTVAADAGSKTGIDPAVLKKMLPILAMLVGGYLSARAGGSGTSASEAGGGGLDSILGSGSAAPAQGGGLGGLGSILDMNRDGNPLDDIIGMAGKFIR